MDSLWEVSTHGCHVVERSFFDRLVQVDLLGSSYFSKNFGNVPSNLKCGVLVHPDGLECELRIDDRLVAEHKLQEFAVPLL